MTQTTEDDRLLIEAVQADPARFVEIYERHVDRIYAFVRRRTEDRAAAVESSANPRAPLVGAILSSATLLALLSAPCFSVQGAQLHS